MILSTPFYKLLTTLEYGFRSALVSRWDVIAKVKDLITSVFVVTEVRAIQGRNDLLKEFSAARQPRLSFLFVYWGKHLVGSEEPGYLPNREKKVASRELRDR